MITITYTDANGKPQEQNILTVSNNMTWGGAKDTGPRYLDFKFLNEPENKDYPQYIAATGDKVTWQDNDKIRFSGYIEKIDYSTETGEVNLHCVDLINNLMKSKFIGRMQGTLNQIGNNICGAFGMKNGITVDNPHVHNIVSTGDMTYFDVLFTACKTMYKNFCLYMDGTTLKLELEHKIQGTFEIGKNIRVSSFEQDASEIVTKVLIIDNKGKVLQAVTHPNPDFVKRYGLFQTTYNYNKDCKNNLAEAQKLLTDDVTNKGYIVVDNDNNCISGQYIKVLEPFNKYEGIFEIQTDEHFISDDSYMKLEIKRI